MNHLASSSWGAGLLCTCLPLMGSVAMVHSVQSRLFLNLWPSSYLCLWSAGIANEHHHIQPVNNENCTHQIIGGIWAQSCMPVILAVGRLGQEDWEFEVSWAAHQDLVTNKSTKPKSKPKPTKTQIQTQINQPTNQTNKQKTQKAMRMMSPWKKKQLECVGLQWTTIFKGPFLGSVDCWAQEPLGSSTVWWRQHWIKRNINSFADAWWNFVRKCVPLQVFWKWLDFSRTSKG